MRAAVAQVSISCVKLRKKRGRLERFWASVKAFSYGDVTEGCIQRAKGVQGKGDNGASSSE